MKKIPFVLIFFVLIIKSLSAQQADTVYRQNCIVQPLFYFGQIVENFPEYPPHEPLQLFELQLLKQNNGTDWWHRSFRYPQTGLVLQYGILGNDSILGRNIAIYPTLILTGKHTGRLTWQMRFGIGFSYFNTPYDYSSNPDNVFIGSHFTNISTFSAGARYRLSSYTELLTGFSACHYSNAHYQLPNVGINTATFYTGIAIYPYKKQNRTVVPTPFEYQKKWLRNIRFSVGWQEFGTSTKPTNGAKFPVYVLALYASKRFTPINQVHLGLFVNYYTGFYDYIVQQQIYNQHQHRRSMVVAPFIGHEFLIGHFGLVAQAGIKLYDLFYTELQKIHASEITTKNYLKRLISTRLGVQYYFRTIQHSTQYRLFLGMYVKANLGQADFWETSIGFSF